MKRVRGCGAVGLGLVALFFGLLAGSVWTHTRLARAERAVDRAWTDLEGEYRERDRVVADLLESRRSASASPEDESLRAEAARRAAADVLPTPELINDADRLARFCRLQEGLDDALRLLRAPAGRQDAAEGDPAARLAASDRRLAAGRLAFDAAAEAYNDMLAVPPASWVGTLAGYRPAARFEAVCGGARL
jgi:hypothetical protein